MFATTNLAQSSPSISGVILIKHCLGNPTEHLLGEDAEQGPSHLKGLVDGAVLIYT